MKKSLYISAIAALFSCAIATTSCSDDTFNSADGQGAVTFDVKVNDSAPVITKAGEDELAASAIIYLYNGEGLIRKYRGTGTLPSELWLNSGDYTVVASAGDSVPASFEKRFFRGKQPFTVKAGDRLTVTTTCRIANSVVVVNFADNVAQGLNNYSLTVANGGGSLTFDQNTEAGTKGYFMMDEDTQETTLNWTLNGTQLNGAAYSLEGTINDVKPTTQYTLNVVYNPTAQSHGAAMFTIEIEEEELIESTVELTAAPAFALGGGRDITADITSPAGEFNDKINVYVTSACQLKNVLVSGEILTSVFGLPESQFDIIAMTAEYTETLADAGITHTYAYNDVDDTAEAKISFNENLFNRLTDGEHTITFTATDVKEKVRTYVMRIVISNAQVEAIELVGDDTYTNRTVLRGNVLVADATDIKFLYRKKGTSQWTAVDADVNGVNASAAIAGLTPGTAYEYTMQSASYYSDKIKTFTTDEERQLPNNSFEDWILNTPYLLTSDANNLFWDTGNHGSSTLGVNVTVPSETYKHSGRYSVDLQSQKVAFLGIGKFASGNFFAGAYLGTDGTDGILGFGRPWTTRPSQLTGYVKYIPKTIDNETSVASGMDKGNIYIALMDDYLDPDAANNGQHAGKYPVIVRTKTKKFFDRNSSHVIGFGEIVWDKATEGSDMVPFTVNIEYRSNKKPSYIILTCAASYYGDYFCGGHGTEMWVDDLNFIYE